jgi:hypothetical protein
MATEARQPSRARHWVYWVLALSLPSVAFVLLHQLVVVHYYENSPPAVYSPAALDRVLLWPVFLTGTLGGFFTLSALILTAVASLRQGVAAKFKVMMWSIVALSCLACVYIWRVQNELVTLVH